MRDTMGLAADEIGAYLLLLGAMWARKDCDLPNDPRVLIRIARTTKAKWNSRIGPAILPLLEVTDEAIFSQRLRKEAVYVQISVTKQRCRKTKENPAKLLKDKCWGLTTDETTEKPPDQPTQQPNNPTVVVKKSPTDSKKNKAEADGLFEDFWNTYPHRRGAKRGKSAARKKWDAAIKRKVEPEEIIQGALDFRRDRKALDGFAPDPASWLFNDGWLDDIEEVTNGNGINNGQASPQGRVAGQSKSSEIADRAARYAESRAQGSGANRDTGDGL